MRPVRPLLLQSLAALLLLASIASGCGGPSTNEAMLPTEMATAEAPARPKATVAATVTAVAQAEITLSPTSTSEPSPTDTLVPTLTPSATIPPTATPCASSGQVVEGSYESVTAGTTEAYRIYLPPCYGESARRYPTLYLFAGNIHDESKWDELGLDEAADAAIRNGDIAPLIVVMPDGGWLANNTSGGPGSYESLVLNDLIPHIESEYCVWAEPQGRAIGGLSRGGYWALEIAFRFPDRFVSAGGHSAALLDQYAGPSINPQYTGLNNPLDDLRIYLDIGDDDYLRTNTIQLHEDMEAAGIVHTWQLNDGRHEDVYWATHVADYLRWYAEPWSLDRETYPEC